MNTRVVIAAVGALLAALGTARPAAAQGCILLRQTSPLFGTIPIGSEVGTWTLTFTGRSSTADRHYRGTHYEAHRQLEQTYVVNKQNAMTATVGYQLTPRVSLNAGIPFVEASWGIPSPRAGGPAARANGNTRGLGDITTLARLAVFNPATSTRTWNLIVGGGIKLPTGNDAATDVYPDRDGLNNVPRYVDISVHPGDGGWGLIADLQGYKALGSRFTAFGSGTWLANPRDTNSTPTRGTAVGDPDAPRFNSVSDQFVFRAGGQVALTPDSSVSLAWRAEGVPRYDVLGASNGRRRPGVEMYWEPGLTVTTGRHTFSFNLPVGYYYNRFPDPYTGNPGDSTFPEYVNIATYSFRFGGKKMQHAMPPIGDQPPATPMPSPNAPRRDE